MRYILSLFKRLRYLDGMTGSQRDALLFTCKRDEDGFFDLTQEEIFYIQRRDKQEARR